MSSYLTFRYIYYDGWIIERGDGTRVESDTEDDTQGDAQRQGLCAWILEQIRKNPKITTEKLVEMSGKSITTIKRRTANMPNLRYKGSGYTFHIFSPFETRLF